MAKNKYQFGTNPKKLQPDYSQENNKKLEVRETPEKDRIKTVIAEKKKRFIQFTYVLVVFAILLTISYRNSLINEKFNQVQSLKKELATIKKENEQAEVNIQNSLNLNNIEQSAKEKLGMQKLTNKQTIYVNLPKRDYVKSTKEKVVVEQDENIFQKIINMIKK